MKVCRKISAACHGKFLVPHHRGTHSPMSILCAMSLRLSGLPCTWRMPTALDTREQSASRCKHLRQAIGFGYSADCYLG